MPERGRAGTLSMSQAACRAMPLKGDPARRGHEAEKEGFEPSMEVSTPITP
jgi:hypothetical protein